MEISFKVLFLDEVAGAPTMSACTCGRVVSLSSEVFDPLIRIQLMSGDIVEHRFTDLVDLFACFDDAHSSNKVDDDVESVEEVATEPSFGLLDEFSDLLNKRRQELK
jgi:hypothetical protein